MTFQCASLILSPLFRCTQSQYDQCRSINQQNASHIETFLVNKQTHLKTLTDCWIDFRQILYIVKLEIYHIRS